MIEHLVVSTFSQKGYIEYGKQFLQGFIKHVPREVILACFYEGEAPTEQAPNVWYFDLNKDKVHQEFKERNKNNPKATGFVTNQQGNPVLDYRFQAIRFSHKIAALTSADLPSSSWRIWLDADVIFKKDIPLAFFDTLLGRDTETVAHYIGRPESVWHCSELGFAAYNTKTSDGKSFLKDLRDVYMSDQVFTLPLTEDSFVFDCIRKHYESQGCVFHNIAAGLEEFHPWPHTVLGEYMTHLKGPVAKQANKPIDIAVNSYKSGVGKKKRQLQTFAEKKPASNYLDLQLIGANCKSRYDQLTNLVGMTKPKRLVEVGTYKGDRAIQMCRPMVDSGQPIHYIGFDIFEDGTPEFHEKEYNGKGNSVYTDVVNKLTAYQEQSKGLFTFELIRGPTNETLTNMELEDIDFAFIDGGHSVETIRSDYEALQNAKVIVFDDFYIKGIDTTKYGCNEVIKSIPYTILPVAEVIQKSGVQVAMVLAGKAVHVKTPLTSDQIKAQQDGGVQIKARNCVEDTVIHNNIRYSARYAKEAKTPELATVSFAPPVLRETDVEIIMVGGSPGIWDKKHSQYNKNWETIRAYHKAGKHIVAVKTSYDVLIARGVVPWGCLLLDPRPHVAESIQTPHKDTIFFMSSMCDKTTWDKFAGGGYKCIGYHAGVLVKEDKIVKELYNNFTMIHGGTTSGFRGVSLFYTLGVRKFIMIGFDSSYEGKPEKVHGKSPKPPIEVHVHGKDFWTDPELIAQSNDMEMLTKHLPGVSIKYVGQGMLQHANEILQDMLIKQRGSRDKAQFQFMPYVTGLQQKNDLAETLSIDSALHYLTERKDIIVETLEKLPTLDEFLVNTTSIPSIKD